MSRYCSKNREERETLTPNTDDGAGYLFVPAPKPIIDENVWAAPKSPKAFMTVKRSREEDNPKLNDDDLRHQIDKRVKFAIDSGCTQSIVCNKALLSDYSSCHVKMATANSGYMNCPLIGTLKIGDLVLKNCLYSPQLATNHLSVSQLCELNYKVSFDRGSCSIKRNSGLTILKGRREGGLYIYEEQKPAAFAATAPSSEKAILAHRRLGHLNYQQLKLLRHLSDGLELDNIPSDPCVPCLQAKIYRKNFSPSNHIASRPGELVHTDEFRLEFQPSMGDTSFLFRLLMITPDSP
jgi:hypothetical protein